MSKYRVLFATMEIEPFLKLSNAADWIRLLPEGLQEKGHEIRIMMPKFGVINERRNRLHEVVRLSGINIRVGLEEKPLTLKVATIPNTRLQVYFLDNEDYFQRKSVLTDAKDKFHTDNDERAIFFCKGVIETVKKLGWTPDIVHCHGWMTSLIPLYLKTHFAQDPIFEKSKVIYTVYNNGEVDHPLPTNFAEKAKLEGVPQDMMSHYSDETFLGVSRGGIQMADAVTKGQEMLDIRLENALIECRKTKAVYPFLQEEEKANIAEHYDKMYHELMG